MWRVFITIAFVSVSSSLVQSPEPSESFGRVQTRNGTCIVPFTPNGTVFGAVHPCATGEVVNATKVCTIECDVGSRQLSGEHAIECLASGEWAPHPTGPKCSFCPANHYQPHTGQNTCLMCPTFSEGRVVGSTSRGDCKCRAGYEGNLIETPNYQDGGVKECHPCHLSTYKDHVGADSCKRCSLLTNTGGTGAQTQLDCRCDASCALWLGVIVLGIGFAVGLCGNILAARRGYCFRNKVMQLQANGTAHSLLSPRHKSAILAAETWLLANQRQETPTQTPRATTAGTGTLGRPQPDHLQLHGDHGGEAMVPPLPVLSPSTATSAPLANSSNTIAKCFSETEPWPDPELDSDEPKPEARRSLSSPIDMSVKIIPQYVKETPRNMSADVWSSPLDEQDAHDRSWRRSVTTQLKTERGGCHDVSSSSCGGSAVLPAQIT